MNLRNKYLTSLIICLCALVVLKSEYSLFADQVNGTAQPGAVSTADLTKNNGSAGAYQMFISVYGGAGITYPAGEISGSSQSKRKIDKCFEGLFQAGYIINPIVSATAGFEYVKETIVIEKSYSQKKAVYTLNYDMIQFSAGSRLSWRFLYADAGMLYSVPIFTWKESLKIDGTTTTTLLYGEKKSWCKKAFGVYLGAGASYAVSDGLNLDLGLRGELALQPVYDNGQDKIQPVVLMIHGGFTYKFQIF